MRRIVLIGALMVVSCSLYQAEVTDLGYIHFGGSDSVFFAAPETVQVATPFEVTVRSYGGGCTRAGSTRVTTGLNDVLVEPFDITDRADACTAILKFFTHRATLQFTKGGTGIVRVRGRARTETARDSLITRERTIVVR